MLCIMMITLYYKWEIDYNKLIAFFPRGNLLFPKLQYLHLFEVLVLDWTS